MSALWDKNFSRIWRPKNPQRRNLLSKFKLNGLLLSRSCSCRWFWWLHYLRTWVKSLTSSRKSLTFKNASKISKSEFCRTRKPRLIKALRPRPTEFYLISWLPSWWSSNPSSEKWPTTFSSSSAQTLIANRLPIWSRSSRHQTTVQLTCSTVTTTTRMKRARKVKLTAVRCQMTLMICDEQREGN